MAVGIRQKRQYNKDVDNYKYFVVNNGKVESGYEFKSDAKDSANDFYPPAKVLTLSQLKQLGIKDPRSEWKYQIGLNNTSMKFKKGSKAAKDYMAKLRSKKVGSTLLISKGENPRKKPTKIVQVDRTKKGTFKKFRTISGVEGKADVKRLKQIALKSKSPLEKKVANIIAKQYTDSGYDSLKSLFEQILYNGLQSGIISELIYYSDTLAWFKKYNAEISTLLRNTMADLGVDSPSDVFGKNWDKSDPFASDTHNQNLLAWFSFEETARNLSYSLGYEV